MDKHPITLRLGEELNRRLIDYCEATDSVRNKFIEHAIEQMLDVSTGVAPIMRAYGERLPLPPIDMADRETIQFFKEHQTYAHGDYNTTLACWLPSVWHEYFADLAQATNRSISGVVTARIARYMSLDELRAYADSKGWPTAYARRYLINHVFPELPFCDFGPAPQRRAFARRPRDK